MVAVAERRPTDEHLGELTAAGDVDAFTALYARHFQGIYDFALRVVRDADTAAEVVYESLAAAWTSLRRSPVEDVRARLYAAAYRAAIAHPRLDKDRPAAPTTAPEPNFTALDTRRLADPAPVLRDPDLVRHVWESAAALAPADYALLDLHLRKSLGPRELGVSLGAKRATIDARLERIKQELVRSVATRSSGEKSRVSALAVFAALAPLAVPPGLGEVVGRRIREQASAPVPRRGVPTWAIAAVAAGALAVAASVLLVLGGRGPDDPTAFRSTTHELGTETSDAAIAVEWAPEPGATGYSILWSNEPALPDETVDLDGGVASATREVTPGQWWFNLRTRDGEGDWTHTVHVGPYVIVPIPETKIVGRPAALSNDPRPVFRLDATGEGTFECSFDGAPFERCDSRPEIGRVRDGRHRLKVRVRDSYGNADASPAVWRWRVDTLSPSTRIVSALLSEREAAFRFASKARHATFECKMDAGEFRRCRSPLSVHDLRQGEHAFLVRAVDAAGNRDRSPAVHRWEIDTKPPKTTIVSGPSGVVHRSRVSFTLDSNEVAVTFECSLDGRAFAACPTTVTYRGLAAGEHTFVARAKDDADNVDATPARRRWTVVDTSAPDTAITGHPRVSSNDASPTFRFRSSEAGSTFECRLDSGSWRACSSPRTYPGLSTGQHVFRVRARDVTGNVDGTPATWTWRIR
jgi:DNA-directed RNA polymerase specialized sigma24 family protein